MYESLIYTEYVWIHVLWRGVWVKCEERLLWRGVWVKCEERLHYWEERAALLVV